MHQSKFVLSFASIGLIYYGSQSLYSAFATPAIQYGKHTGSSDAASANMIPGAVALIVGLILAFACIFWWASAIGRRPRRYSVPVYTPPTQSTVTSGRTLADMAAPPSPKPFGQSGHRAQSTSFQGRRVHNITRDQPKAAEIPTSTGTATPPPFDPY